MHLVHREGLHLLTHRKHSKYLKKDLEKEIVFSHIYFSALLYGMVTPYTNSFTHKFGRAIITIFREYRSHNGSLNTNCRTKFPNQPHGTRFVS